MKILVYEDNDHPPFVGSRNEDQRYALLTSQSRPQANKAMQSFYRRSDKKATTLHTDHW